MPIHSRLRPHVLWLAPWGLLGGFGCDDPSADGLPRHAVSGSITLDGKPLESGMISFDPDEGAATPVSGGGLVQGGQYSIGRATGLTPGVYRVSIRSGGGTGSSVSEAPGGPPKKAAKDLVPEQYNAKSTLKADLKDGGSTRFDFDLKTQ